MGRLIPTIALSFSLFLIACNIRAADTPLSSASTPTEKVSTNSVIPETTSGIKPRDATPKSETSTNSASPLPPQGSLEYLDAKNGFMDAHFGQKSQEISELKPLKSEGRLSEMWRGPMTVAGITVDRVLYSFLDDHLYRIEVPFQDRQQSLRASRVFGFAYGQGNTDKIDTLGTVWEGKKGLGMLFLRRQAALHYSKHGVAG